MNFKTEAECKVTYAAWACENIGKKGKQTRKKILYFNPDDFMPGRSRKKEHNLLWISN